MPFSLFTPSPVLQPSFHLFLKSQFRRAVWLNPYEPAFRIHWAVALIKLNRLDEARNLLQEVLRKQPDDPFAVELWRRHWPDKPVPESDAPVKTPSADGSLM